MEEHLAQLARPAQRLHRPVVVDVDGFHWLMIWIATLSLMGAPPGVSLADAGG